MQKSNSSSDSKFGFATPKEVMGCLKMDYQSVLKLMRSPDFPTTMLNNRYRVSYQALADWVENSPYKSYYF